jgi:hypothetical protein
VETTRRVVEEKRRTKDKEVLHKKEVVDHKVVIEKIGHRDRFYE